MKAITPLILFLLAISNLHSFGDDSFDFEKAYIHPSLEKIWELSPESGFHAPESIIYDSKLNRLYVSNFNMKGGFIQKGDVSADEPISLLSLNGEILDRDWMPGLESPLGMIFDEERQHLFVVERRQVTVIDASGDKGERIAAISVEGTAFPNDIARDHKGRLYISDGGKKIWRCVDWEKSNRFELWFEGEAIEGANGLLAYGNELLVGCNDDQGIVAIELESKTTRQVAAPRIRPIDGLQSDGKDGLFVSWFRGRLAWVSFDGQQREILINNPDGPGIADFEYIPEKRIFILPDLLGNGIQAYHLKEAF